MSEKSYKINTKEKLFKIAEVNVASRFVHEIAEVFVKAGYEISWDKVKETESIISILKVGESYD